MSIRDESGATTLDPKSEFISRTKDFPLINESIEVSPGVFLERPNPALIEALTRLDSRIRYVPLPQLPHDIMDEDIREFFAKLADVGLPPRIRHDFPDGDFEDLSMRGITASLRDEFPCYPTRNYDKQGFIVAGYPSVDNSITILQNGTEGGVKNSPPGSQPMHSLSVPAIPKSYLYGYTQEAVQNLERRGQSALARNLFPALAVYRTQTIDDWGTIPPRQRIIAMYLTDRIIDRRPKQTVASAGQKT